MSILTPQGRPGAEAHATTPEGSSDRVFGLVFCGVFALIAFYPVIKGAPIRYWALGLAALLFAVAFAMPRVLAPLNRLWTRFGMVLHRVVSPIALFAVFCLAVVPTGLVLRALRKDLLRLRREPASRTYWIERAPPGRPDEQMKKQF